MKEASQKDSSKFLIMCVALRVEKLDICGFHKCELGSGGPLPDSHSNGFWAVKVGEGDCNEFYKAMKSVHQRRKRASMDRETTWTDLLLQNFTFAKYFKESLAIKSLLWKKREDPHKTTFKKRTLSFFLPTHPYLQAGDLLSRVSFPLSQESLSSGLFSEWTHFLSRSSWSWSHPNCKLYDTIS